MKIAPIILHFYLKGVADIFSKKVLKHHLIMIVMRCEELNLNPNDPSTYLHEALTNTKHSQVLSEEL